MAGPGPVDERGLLSELREGAEGIARLSENEESFRAAIDAFRALDGESLQALLERHGLLEYCRLICRWFCSKECVLLCLELCGPPRLEDEEVAEHSRVRERRGAGHRGRGACGAARHGGPGARSRRMARADREAGATTLLPSPLSLGLRRPLSADLRSRLWAAPAKATPAPDPRVAGSGCSDRDARRG